MMKIRKLKKEDIPQMINLYAEFLKDQYGRNKYYVGDYSFKRGSEYYEKIIKSDRDEIFIGEDNGNVAGFTTISISSPNSSLKFESYGYLYDGFIREEYRTSKLSFCLFNECEKWAKEKNCKYITAYAYAFNKKVQVCFQAKKMEPYKITYIKEIN